MKETLGYSITGEGSGELAVCMSVLEHWIAGLPPNTRFTFTLSAKTKDHYASKRDERTGELFGENGADMETE